MKYNDNGTYRDIYVKAFDTLPVGTEVDYDGETVPTGWTEVDDYTEYELTNLPAHSIGNNLYQLIKINKLISLNVNSIWFNSITANSWFTIGQLPSEIYPPIDISGIAVIVSGDSGNTIGIARIWIDTNGVIKIKSNTTNNSLSGCSLSITWVLS